MSEQNPPAPAIDERDAAKFIGYSTAYLKLCRREGRGPAFVRTGRSIRYLVADLEVWLRLHRVETRESRQAERAEAR